MAAVLLTLLLALPAADGDTRPPHPLAPSLPRLSDAEEDRLDDVINRFIDAETGALAGPEARRAVEEFRKLGPEATFALIRGLNRAARIETSCPAVVIARKLSTMLGASRDRDLLQFARDNIGSGVGRTKHAPVLQNLRVMCGIRQGALTRAGITTVPSAGMPPPATQSSLRTAPSTRELVRRAGEERGERLMATLKELGARDGDEALGALGTAAASYEPEVRALAGELLQRQLGRLSTARLREQFKNDRPEVRAAAARAAAARKAPVPDDLIDLLLDAEPPVRQAAHDALVKLSGGTDLGPGDGADAARREAAARAWRDWWRQRSRP